MQDIIRAFSENKKVAIAGASDNKDNFGRSLMEELDKLGYETLPVNPKYDTVLGKDCQAAPGNLPPEFENLILAVPPALTEKIIDQCEGSPVKRVWMVRGVGKGAYSKPAHERCKALGIEVVYGFCPLMFLGSGPHRFHFWLRKTFGKMPPEYTAAG